MSAIPQPTSETSFLQHLQSAAVVYLSSLLGVELNPSELAQHRGSARSTVYRQAQRLWSRLQQVPILQKRVGELEEENQRLQQQVRQQKAQIASSAGPLDKNHIRKAGHDGPGDGRTGQLRRRCQGGYSNRLFSSKPSF